MYTSDGPPASPPPDSLFDRSTPDAEIELRFRLTRFAHLRWQMLHQLRMPFLHVLAVAIGVMFSAYSNTASRAFFTLLLAYLATWIMQLLSVVLLILPARNPRLLTDYRIDLFPGGLRVSTPHADGVYRWSGLIRVVDGFGVVAVYTTSNSACVVPFSAFLGPDQKRQFIELINARRIDL